MKSWAIRIALVGAAFGVLTCLSSAWAPVARARAGPTDRGLAAMAETRVTLARGLRFVTIAISACRRRRRFPQAFPSSTLLLRRRARIWRGDLPPKANGFKRPRPGRGEPAPRQRGIIISSRGTDGAAMKTWFKRILIGLVVLVVVAVVGLHLLADIRSQCVQVQAGRACQGTPYDRTPDHRRRDRALAVPAHRPGRCRGVSLSGGRQQGNLRVDRQHAPGGGGVAAAVQLSWWTTSPSAA